MKIMKKTYYVVDNQIEDEAGFHPNYFGPPYNSFIAAYNSMRVIGHKRNGWYSIVTLDENRRETGRHQYRFEGDS